MLKTLAPLDGSSDASCATGASPSTSHSKVIAQRLMGSPRQEASHRMSQGHIGQEWLPAGGAAASPVSAVLLKRWVRADVAAQSLDAS
jgi:hypothetical protein